MEVYIHSKASKRQRTGETSHCTAGSLKRGPFDEETKYDVVLNKGIFRIQGETEGKRAPKGLIGPLGAPTTASTRLGRLMSAASAALLLVRRKRRAKRNVS